MTKQTCKACNGPIVGERKRRYCDDTTCRAKRGKERVKSFRKAPAKRRRNPVTNPVNAAEGTDVPENHVADFGCVQSTDNTRGFCNKNRVLASGCTPEVSICGLPINILGGHRFPGPSRLPADLRRTIFETEVGEFLSNWTFDAGVYTSKTNSELTIRPDAVYPNMWRIHHHGRVSDLVNLGRAKAAIDDTSNYTAETIDANPEWLDAIQPRSLPQVEEETVPASDVPVMSPAVIALLDDDGHPTGIPVFLRRAAT